MFEIATLTTGTFIPQRCPQDRYSQVDSIERFCKSTDCSSACFGTRVKSKHVRRSNGSCRLDKLIVTSKSPLLSLLTKLLDIVASFGRSDQLLRITYKEVKQKAFGSFRKRYFDIRQIWVDGLSLNFLRAISADGRMGGTIRSVEILMHNHHPSTKGTMTMKRTRRSKKRKQKLIWTGLTSRFTRHTCHLFWLRRSSLEAQRNCIRGISDLEDVVAVRSLCSRFS